jgi:hypothetical protein
MTSRTRLVTLCSLVAVIALLWVWRSHRRPAEVLAAPPVSLDERAAPARSSPDDREPSTRELTMADVLEMARRARAAMAENLDDYTARFVKQEVDHRGVLGEQTEMLIKEQTRLRGDREDAPLRVYLKFLAPQSLHGREVIWGEDLYDGRLAVHEVGLLLSLKTIWLDPNGIFAMQGQRYPISEIGLVRLVEKLIERGEQDRDSPDVRVTLHTDHRLGDLATQLIQVRRTRPGGRQDDFSRAEIVIDPQRQLILRYRAFGWPEAADQPPPLQESYTYYDVQTNVGLTEADFDVNNPQYGFPAL